MGKYIVSLAILALLIPNSLAVLAQDASVEVDVSTDVETTRPLPVRSQTQTGVRTEVRADLEIQRQERMAEMESRRAEMDARRETMRAEAEVRRAEAQERRAEFQRDIAMRRVENASRVILATIERLGRIADRIDSRIEKIVARGGDTAEGARLVAVARGNLSAARASVEAFVSIDLSSDIAQENFERVRLAAAEAREHIREAHRNLTAAVRSLSTIEASIEVSSEGSVE